LEDEEDLVEPADECEPAAENVAERLKIIDSENK
jgi:hypothetical protein